MNEFCFQLEPFEGDMELKGKVWAKEEKRPLESREEGRRECLASIERTI
jgi:hypothetical protein